MTSVLKPSSINSIWKTLNIEAAEIKSR